MMPLIVSFQVTRPVVVSPRGRTWLRPLRAALSHLVSCLPHRCVPAVLLSNSPSAVPPSRPSLSPPAGGRSWLRPQDESGLVDPDDPAAPAAGVTGATLRMTMLMIAETERGSSGFQRCRGSVLRSPVLTSASSW